MRPLKLTITAFSSYADKIVLDMDKLGKKGLYLITGETGAGKTTIFDAITFALYGKPSGTNRKSDMLRSKYADPDTKTEVEMTFEYDGKIYKIARTPEYTRPAKRGGGFTSQRAEAELTLPDGKVISKLRDVDTAVRDILGVDRDQFSQIAMIAQGDFIKLLTATTENRQEIFRKLFGTAFYRNIQEKLKTEFAKIKKDYEASENSIRQYIATAVCGEEYPLFSELEKAKKRELSTDEATTIISEIIVLDTDEESRLENEISTADKLIEKTAELLVKAEEHEKAQADYAASVLRLTAENEHLTQLEKMLDTEKARQTEAEKISQEITLLEAQLPEYDEHEKCISELEEISGRITENRINEKNAHDMSELLKQELLKLSNELASLADAGEKKEKLMREKVETEAKKQILLTLRNSISEYKKSQANFERLQLLYLKASEEAAMISEKYNAQYKAFLDEQAGILAEKLTEGMPCPVCGSTQHPNTAKKSENAPTEAELKIWEENAAKAQETAAEASKDAGVAKGEFSTVKAKTEQQLLEITGTKDIDCGGEIADKLLDEADGLIIALSDRITQENEHISRKEKLAEIIPEKQKVLGEMEEKTAIFKEVSTKNESLKKAAEARLEKLSEKLSFESATAAKNEIRAKKKSAAEIRNALDAAEKNYRECENRITSLRGKIEQLEKQLSQVCETDTSIEKARKNELTQKRSVMFNRQKAVHARIISNQSIINSINSKLAEAEILRKRYGSVKALCDTATGNLSGHEKVMLETYVQAAYFEKIIHRANYRLRIMTSNQYELRRRREAENNRSQSGLELEIIDHYNGSIRDVKSLSGGESFKASLALALGLSDEIESSAGGIKLDTMFIDEGFGSLDENSLQQAINALAQLTGETRLVGIISHVSELKRKIDKQIVVTKKKGETLGTTAQIIC